MDNAEEDQLDSLMQFLRAEVDSEMHLKLARGGISDNPDWKHSILQVVDRARNGPYETKLSAL